VIDYKNAELYITEWIRTADRKVVVGHIARLVEFFQEHSGKGLAVDGIPGQKTLAALRPAVAVLSKVYPLPVLADGRKPSITSGFKTQNPDRPNHDGCDLFYRWQASDGPVKMGNGGATRGPDGKPKWFIPAGTHAIAAADGVVQQTDLTRTGWRVWVTHSDGNRTGYFHLQNSLVRAGDALKQGAKLGLVGDNPADVDAQHLHFEVSPIERYAPIDPDIWLRGAGFFSP
jgi:murein DD-endopeptidase MepM/ murein hydrolase activator NlpD